MKVHKVTLLIVDTDDVGPSVVRETLENGNYPNDCIDPQVMDIETKEVAWSDDHPLNKNNTQRKTYNKMFSPTEDDLHKIITEWIFYWASEEQNPPHEQGSYRRRAMGIDANMRYNLVQRLLDKIKGNISS